MAQWFLLLAVLLCRDPADFDGNIAPFQAVRAAEPDNVLVHERYQDAVRRFGIEGHLKAMGEEYQALAAQHSGDPMYRYLAARSLIGRATQQAMQSLIAIASEHPDFAPARRALDQFAKAPPLPERNPSLETAERLLHENGDAQKILQMAAAAIRADEWRLQRIRAFDWYSVEVKRETLREVQAEYWRFWEIQVHCFRRTGQMQQADELLATMQRRAAKLADPERVAQVDRLRAGIGQTALPRN